MVLHRGRKGNVCNPRSGFCRQEEKGTAPEREFKVGSERAASPCEVLVLLVPAAVSCSARSYEAGGKPLA